MIRPWYLIPLAGRSADELEAVTSELRSRLAGDVAIAEVTAEYQRAVRPGGFRRFVLGTSIAELIAAVERPRRSSAMMARIDWPARLVVFMFPGGGAQHAHMAADLFMSDEGFRQDAERCARLFEERMGLDVLAPLSAEPGTVLDDLRLELASLFTVEYALACWWLSLGVRPAALIGHSLGEYVAAVVAGTVDLADAIALVSVRATLLARLPSGAMSSVEAGEHEIAPLLGDGLSIAAVNGPRRCVVSGPRPSVEELETRLAAGGIHVQRLRIRGAGHSAQVDGILEEFGSFAAGIRQRPGQIPAVSNLSGTWLTPAEAIDPAYWKRHLRAPVRFVDGLRTLLDVHEDAVFVEVGPGTSLSTLTRQNEPAACVVSSLPHPLDPAPDGAVITRAVGQLWLAGADIDWPAVASRVGAARNVAG